MRTDEQLRRDLAKLQKQKCVAFACACAEHVLPIYEKHFEILSNRQQLASSTNVRSTLELIWRCAFGEEVSSTELESADAASSAAIPRIDVDQSVEAEMSMAASVGVLEALDATKSDGAGAAERASSNALKAIMVACYIKNPHLPQDIDPIPLIASGKLNAQPEWEPLVHEFEVQNTQLDELLHLSSNAYVTAEWKSHHLMHGILLLKKLGWD